MASYYDKGIIYLKSLDGTNVYAYSLGKVYFEHCLLPWTPALLIVKC